jgi:poly(A) polymerase
MIGKARNYLLELRMEEGPLGPEEARKRLLEWAAKQGIGPDTTHADSE